MPDLTEIFAAVNDIERNLYLPEGTILECFKGSASLGTIAAGWFVEDYDFRATGGKKFKKLSVSDPERLHTARLANCDQIKIGSQIFKISDKDQPFEQTREWIIELQPTGQSPS